MFMFMLRLSAGAVSVVRWRGVCPARSAAAGAEQQDGCCNRDRSLGAARSSVLTLARVTGFWRSTHNLLRCVWRLYEVIAEPKRPRESFSLVSLTASI